MLSAKPAEEEPPKPSEPPPPAPHPDFPPFHVVLGLSNFRDIGGWPITSSATSTPEHVRKGLLYRGSDTNRLQQAGEEKLRQLGVKTDFDLRSKQQIEKAGGYKEIEGIERRWTPVFAEEAYTEEAARKRYELYAGEGTEGIVTAFVEILTAGAPMFHTVLTHLLATVDTSENPPGLFMHCTTGNNRTGVFISLLLLLLHVPSSFVVQEYALSEQGLASTRHINVERLLKKGAFEKYGPEEARRKCERMVDARKESMEALLEEVERRWVDAEGYFKRDVGLSDEQVAGLRDIFTAEGEADQGRGANATVNLNRLNARYTEKVPRYTLVLRRRFFLQLFVKQSQVLEAHPGPCQDEDAKAFQRFLERDRNVSIELPRS